MQISKLLIYLKERKFYFPYYNYTNWSYIMPDGSMPLLISLIVLVIFSGFFSATETAFSCASRIKLRTLHSNGNKKAGKVLLLAEKNYDKLISTILIGNNIVNLSASTIATILFAKLLVNTSFESSSSVISTAVITIAVLIFGEITPKYIAKTFPEKFSMMFYPVINLLLYIFYPINFLFSGWKWLISKLFNLKNEEIITEDEIMTIVQEAQEDGTLKQEETKLIRSVIEFDDLEVGDILTPRINIAAVDEKDSMKEIQKVFESTGYSRLPVYKESVDTIIGTIHEKDFYNSYITDKKNVKDIMQNAFYTTKHTKISNLLKQLQKQKVHMAIVLDEYGGTLGIVTMEDILEELVGEILDEHDEEVSYFKTISENTFIIDGHAPLNKTFELLHLDGKDENFEANTVSGWVIESLGEIPTVGKTFTYENLSVEVLKSTVKKVLQIRVLTTTESEEE